MHLKQLKSFLAVYEEGSFGKAAARLHTTQPGLSTQVALLETELNVKLFHRHARGITPTAAGQHLYLKGRQLLGDMNAALEELQALSGVVTGTISAGLSPALGRAILARVLTRYAADYPEVDLRVAEDYSSTLISLLENQLLDFALVAHIPNHPTLKFEYLYSDRFVAVHSKNSGIDPAKPLRLNKPPFHKLVVPSVRHGAQSALDVSIRTGRIVPEKLIEVNSASGVLELAATTDWVTLIPYTTIHYDFDSTRLNVNAIEGDDIRMDYYVAHAGTEPLSAASNAFLSIVKTELLQIERNLKPIGGDKLRAARAKKREPAGKKR